jgi:elongation factor Ts
MTSATEIKAADVQKLRQMTGAGLMECKAALIESKGDTEKAIRILREKGIAKSSKRADRVAAEGLIETWLADSAQDGILLELNSETDFVARNPDFSATAKKFVELIRNDSKIATVEQLPGDLVTDLSAKTGEKISLRRFIRFTTKQGVVAIYVHPGSKLAVMIQIDSDKAGSPSEALKTLAKELALQIAGANPRYVSADQVPADIIQREKDIVKKQMEGQNKPAEMLEKIATGKLGVFFEANCLLDQPHVRDSSGKTKVRQIIDETGKKEGAQLQVARFVRFRVGAD